jgi:hypothetical protein
LVGYFIYYIFAKQITHKMDILFTKNCLQINLSRNEDNTISIEISSDFANSQKKSQLYVNEDNIRFQVEQFWKSIRTKKLLFLQMYFSEIDSYNSSDIVYKTPTFSIARGLKKVVLERKAHNNIPKDWSIVVKIHFADTLTYLPIFEVLEKMLVHKFTTNAKVEVVKKLKSFLRKEIKEVNYYNANV